MKFRFRKFLRLTATANLGTNADGLMPGAQPPQQIPSNALTARYTYDNAGNLLTTTDPRGVVTRTERDALGRVTREVDGYVNNVTSPTSDRITTTLAGFSDLGLGTVLDQSDGNGISLTTTLDGHGPADRPGLERV